MGKLSVGDKFTLWCGVEVVVVEYNGHDSVLVECSEGIQKITNSNFLRTGKVGWTGQRFNRNRDAFLASMKFPVKLRSGVLVYFKEYITASRILVEDEIGNSKYVSADNLRTGNISWSKFGFPNRNIPPDGSIFESEKYGKYTIIRYFADTDKVDVLWERTNTVRENCDRLDAMDGRITDKSQWDINNMPSRYYVYATRYNDEWLYVGKGTKLRYKHTLNGCSHVFGLNELFFKGCSVDTIIIKDGLSEHEAYLLEAIKVEELRPKFNVHKNFKIQSSNILESCPILTDSQDPFLG